MRGERDTRAVLARAIRRDAAAAGCCVTLESLRSEPWFSATFVGARHAWQLAEAGVGADAWLAGLSDTDLTVPGHLLADLSVVRDGGAVTIEALILEAA